MPTKKKKPSKDTESKKLTRVQFPKDSTAEEILTGIRKTQREWAKKYPERAHRLYPEIYDVDGNVIPKAEEKSQKLRPSRKNASKV